MQLFIGALGSLLAWVFSRFVPKLLFALGIGYVGYKGADALVSAVQGYLSSLQGGLAAPYVEGWRFFGGDIGLSMIMSAWTVRAAFVVGRKIVAAGASA